MNPPNLPCLLAVAIKRLGGDLTVTEEELAEQDGNALAMSVNPVGVSVRVMDATDPVNQLIPLLAQAMDELAQAMDEAEEDGPRGGVH